ncbi:MAG TPA: FtsX-like permease family protein [Vicinamibacterales bacterium]|nr:FtsX-like permease family protein [Vicinamibacterales bacterium]
MRSFRSWLARLGGTFRRTTRDHKFVDELHANLQAHIDDNVRAGMTPIEPEVYFPADQVAIDIRFMWPQHLVVRAAGDPLALAAAVRRAVSDVDPDEPVSNIQSMEQVFAADVLNRNTQMILVAVFAALALVMASVGLYGVLSYTVTRRLPEIGVRMALGAARTTVVMEIVRGALLLAASGIVLGAAGAFAATRLLVSSLFSVSRADRRRLPQRARWCF